MALGTCGVKHSCGGGCSVVCRMCGSIPGLYLLCAVVALPAEIARGVPRHCHMSLEKQLSQLDTTTIHRGGDGGGE